MHFRPLLIYYRYNILLPAIYPLYKCYLATFMIDFQSNEILNHYFYKKISLDKNLISATALETIRLEKNAVENLSNYVNDHFIEAVACIHQSKGRVIISGIGKSAIIAQKIVATFNSTGTPAIFMHAADAIHGDLGMMQTDDVAIVISKSGESAEIKVLVPLIKNFGNKLIAICGNEKSFLATNADFLVDSTVNIEACPNNLAPTSSTTAQMVMGDAMAVCLLKLKGFTADHFAKFHPGGALGKQLYLQVATLSNSHEKPIVYIGDSIQKVIVEITGKRLGATIVLNAENEIEGIITDGDIRRMLEKHTDLGSIQATDIMNRNPKCIESDALAVDALAIMRQYNITQLVVVSKGTYAGIIHLHDLLNEGLF
jgi:arabinose-5-phosphate isomerase